jgi:hypothetical protein
MSRRVTDDLRWMAITGGASAPTGTELGLQTDLADQNLRLMASGDLRLRLRCAGLGNPLRVPVF